MANKVAELTHRFDDALVYATHVHTGQVRKGTSTPYIAHLLAVAATVLEYGGDEDLAIAGLLHDSVEDRGGKERLAEISKKFGDRVAKVVENCSDSIVDTTKGEAKPPRFDRMQEYLKHLETADNDALRVSLADKVHNARSILRDLRTPAIGESVFDRFSVPMNTTLWYYRSLANIFCARLPGQLSNELLEIIDAVEADAASTGYVSLDGIDAGIDTAALVTLLKRFKPKERRGSKPRCHLLTHGSQEVVADRLTKLVAPFASVAPTDSWMPQGFEDTVEATLPEAERLLGYDERLELQRWWLAANGARTPNWDIASTCTIGEKAGILLIEGKAHDQELIKEETGRKNIEAPVSRDARRNLLRIDWAIRDANVALAEDTHLPWALSRDWNYQMSNRFAWAWKLTDLQIPVVLVYLGFLSASEMRDRGNPLTDPADWEKVVKRHSQALFPSEVWGKQWTCGGRPFIPLIRSLEVLFNAPASA